jgi:hypothetical protein
MRELVRDNPIIFQEAFLHLTPIDANAALTETNGGQLSTLD